MRNIVRIPRRPGAKPQQRGSTMIEVLIAIVVLALGMMGMLGMFLNSLKIASGSIYRNTATQHAYMMGDFVRSNRVNIQNYFTPTATLSTACFGAAGGACDSVRAMTTNTAMPNTEYKVWETQLANLLPAGQGKVCRDSIASSTTRSSPGTMAAFLTCDNGGPVVVKVCWDESRIQKGNLNVSNTDQTQFRAGGAQCIYTVL
ncbi:MAG TPA: type IV pilus modification protein PilV [Burkholderiales bacterium]|jgi:type IV pilus assembly protein PilV